MTMNAADRRRKDFKGIIRALLIGIAAGALIVGSVAAHGQEPIPSPKPQKHHHISKKLVIAIGATAAALTAGAIINGQKVKPRDPAKAPPFPPMHR